MSVCLQLRGVNWPHVSVISELPHAGVGVGGGGWPRGLLFAMAWVCQGAGGLGVGVHGGALGG